MSQTTTQNKITTVTLDIEQLKRLSLIKDRELTFEIDDQIIKVIGLSGDSTTLVKATLKTKNIDGIFERFVMHKSEVEKFAKFIKENSKLAMNVVLTLNYNYSNMKVELSDNIVANFLITYTSKAIPSLNMVEYPDIDFKVNPSQLKTIINNKDEFMIFRFENNENGLFLMMEDNNINNIKNKITKQLDRFNSDIPNYESSTFDSNRFTDIIKLFGKDEIRIRTKSLSQERTYFIKLNNGWLECYLAPRVFE
jgi:hypothetical protein